MKHIKVTDEWLYESMPVVDAAIIQELESRVDKGYKFSSKFERKMKYLIWRESHQLPTVIQSIMKRTAIFFVGAIGAILIFTMSVEAYRIKFFETMKTFFEDSFILSYFTDINKNKLVNREPSYLPEGYNEIDRTENENYLSITYENAEGDLLLWDQMLVTDGGSMIFDLEYEREEIIDVQGYEAKIFYYENNYRYIYFEYEEYSYMIITDSISTDEICRILESVFK